MEDVEEMTGKLLPPSTSAAQFGDSPGPDTQAPELKRLAKTQPPPKIRSNSRLEVLPLIGFGVYLACRRQDLDQIAMRKRARHLANQIEPVVRLPIVHIGVQLSLKCRLDVIHKAGRQRWARICLPLLAIV